jgi:DNA-binding NtrC family response regulator
MMSPRVQATLLLIGDQAALHAEGLRLQGYQVVTAAHVLEAEALGPRLGLAHLDLVILDFQVAEADTLVQGWGARAPTLPFILVSNSRMPGWLDPPVVWWLVTPLTLDTLVMVVRDVLGS